MIWLVIGGYLLCGLITARIAAGHVFDNGKEDREVVAFQALCAGLFWPFSIGFAVLVGLGWLVTWKLPEERRRNRRERLRDQEREADERMRNIRRMERELGIGDSS